MRKILWLLLMLATPMAWAAEGTAAPEDATLTPFERDFRKTDANHDEKITHDEAEQMKAALLLTNFEKMDANHDGGLDRAELMSFLRTAMQNQMRAQQEEFNNRLKAADTNKDGALTKKELKAAKDKLPSLEKYFDAIDADHNKKITGEEILTYARANQPK